jgi:RecA/RadA recombinase
VLRTTSRVIAIVGPGGAGKTALAVHWAHRHLPAFDGGQLYVNLHGFGLDPEVDAFEALGQLLRGLGQPNDALPATLDERAAQYRSLVSGRRMLIVLDNAADGRQVRPLLPGAGTHVTLITSRRRLDSLAAGEGVRRLPLQPLPSADAMDLLRQYVERDRAADDLLAEVTRISEGLPLALRIVAARLAATPDDRFLSQMSLRIFRAGLKHSVVDAKWPAFEEVFHDFDPRELHLIEALRTLRIMHYAAWLARRWEDPAFKIAFPWFNSQRYWDEHVLALREQVALMEDGCWRESPATMASPKCSGSRSVF